MPRNNLIIEFAKEKDIDEDLAREAISNFFKYMKMNMASHLPYTIRLKHLGVFKPALIRVQVAIKRLNTIATKRDLTPKEKEKLSNLIKYLEIYGIDKKTKGE